MEKIIVAKAMLFDDNGKILLVRRSKTAPRRPLEWDLPGGFVDDDDQSYQHACLREVDEETHVKVREGHLKLAYTESDCGTFGDKQADVSWLYFEGQAETTEVRLSYEHDDSTWVDLAEAQLLITYDRQLHALGYVAALRAGTAVAS